MMTKMKFSQTPTLNKKVIFLTLLFILGTYHLLMCLAKLNAFNINSELLTIFKHVLTRFYHISTMLLIGVSLIWNWENKYNWFWVYIGFKIVYNLITLSPNIKTMLNKSLLDGVYFGILIIIILLILRDEKVT